MIEKPPALEQDPTIRHEGVRLDNIQEMPPIPKDLEEIMETVDATSLPNEQFEQVDPAYDGLGNKASQIAVEVFSAHPDGATTEVFKTNSGPLEVHETVVGSEADPTKVSAMFSSGGVMRAVRIESSGKEIVITNPDSRQPSVLIDGEVPQDPAEAHVALSKISVQVNEKPMQQAPATERPTVEGNPDDQTNPAKTAIPEVQKTDKAPELPPETPTEVQGIGATAKPESGTGDETERAARQELARFIGQYAKATGIRRFEQLVAQVVKDQLPQGEKLTEQMVSVAMNRLNRGEVDVTEQSQQVARRLRKEASPNSSIWKEDPRKPGLARPLAVAAVEVEKHLKDLLRHSLKQ